MAPTAADVLLALADLLPGDPTPSELIDVSGKGDQPFAWLGDEVDPGDVFGPWKAGSEHPAAVRVEIERTPVLKRLRSLDSLHDEERLLRAGWLFLCGPVRVRGRLRQVCTPLVQRPIRILGVPTLLPLLMIDQLGDTELTLSAAERDAAIHLPWFGNRLVERREVEAHPVEVLLEATGVMKKRERPPVMRYERIPAAELVEHPRLRAWVDQVLQAAGLEPGVPLVADVNPGNARSGDRPVVVIGTGLFVHQAPKTTVNAGALREWSVTKGIDRTAFAHLYGVARGDGGAPPDDRPSPQPLPLTAAQAAVVRVSRSAAVAVLSGAPGNGKSHAVCAVALDAVARGQSVLVATPSSYAADVLGELLARQPGPEPVLFGETADRRRMNERLEAAGQRTLDDAALDRLQEAAAAAEVLWDGAETTVVDALQREVDAGEAGAWTMRLPDLRAAVPGAFAPGADLAALRARVDAVRARPRWWRTRRLRRLVGSAPIVGVDAIADAVEAAVDLRAERELDVVGGTAIGAAWDELLAAEAAWAAASGAYLDGLVRAEDRWRGPGRRAVAGLVASLRAGRATRRDLLAELDADALVCALPLWVGTLRDVEDLLPVRPGLFDLVIVDEAAQVDQFRAAGALLRGKRAVVAGDPRQLRPVSFVADAAVAAQRDEHGVLLDVRRQALYDVAAGAAPVAFLDEHHRSLPHLIDFSARRFYDGRVLVATRHPSNEADDVIDTVRVGSVAAEVGAVVDLIATAVDAGRVGIGAYTPFREHADAIESAVLARFEPEVLVDHGIRTGTAHSAQGSERDEVIVALGLSVDDPAARWRFVEDPNLFNVLVTRARRRLTVVTALPAGGEPRGIVRDYLRHAEHPPAPPPGSAVSSPWATALATELGRNGVDVRVGYPVGRWTVDVCAGSGDGAVALDCAVHPEGPQAHVARHRALRRAGWRVLDAFPSRWDDDAAVAAVELATGFRPGGDRP